MRVFYFRDQSEFFRQGFKPVALLGNIPLRFLGFIGAAFAAVLAGMSILGTALTHPWDLMNRILLFIFAFAAAVVEGGKFIIYELIGSFLLTRGGGLFWSIAGIYNTTIGLLYIFYSCYGSRKLSAIKDEAVELYKENFEGLFEEADTNHDGFLDAEELDILSTKLGLALSPNELQVMVNYLDSDRDGKLSIAEFKLWFEQNKLPTLV